MTDIEYEFFGCPHMDYEGRSKAVFTNGADEPPWSATCPRYFYETPLMQSLLSDLKDYRRGAMGDVRDLYDVHLTALRVLDSEMTVWESENDKKVASWARGDIKAPIGKK